MNIIKYGKLSDYHVKKILWLFCIDIDATKASLILCLNRHTINRYYRMFRESIYLHQMKDLDTFLGDVELDESYFGAKRVRGFHGKLKRGRGTLKKPVFGVLKRNGKVYTEIVPDAKKKTLLPIILGKVDPKSVVYTDGWRAYDGLVSVGYDKHFRVNHGKNEFALDGDVTINGIESFWSFTKRRLAKFNGYSKNFELHLKECEWRWNKDEKQLFDELKVIFKNYLTFFNLLA